MENNVSRSRNFKISSLNSGSHNAEAKKSDLNNASPIKFFEKSDKDTNEAVTFKIPQTPESDLKTEDMDWPDNIASNINDAVSKRKLGIIPTTGDWLGENIKKINPENVDDILFIYSEKYGETLFDAIMKERGLSAETRAEYLKYIKNQLLTRMEGLGVYTDDISLDFDKEINYQMKKIGIANTEYINSFLSKLDNRQKAIRPTDANGEIDEDFKQGPTGNCWLLASIKAISKTPKGQQILNDSIKVDKFGNVSVTLKGVGKTYIITREELMGNAQFSHGDGDVRALEIALDRYFMDERGVNIRKDLNGNKPWLAYKLLTGKGGKNYISDTFGRIAQSWFTDKQIDNFNKENHVAVVSATFKNKTYSFKNPAEEDEVITLTPSHAYTVKGSDENYVYLISPWDTSKDISVPRDVFKNYFNYVDEFDL